jgi:hypothetical protein
MELETPYLPTRFDRPKSGTFAKILVRSSTAICVNNFNLASNFVKGLKF